MTRRAGPFVAVGALGFGLQMLILAWLIDRLRWPYLPATAAAVEAAVLHNFWWHQRWTWGDRERGGVAETWRRLIKFQVGAGISSVAGNLAVTAAVVELFRVPPLFANALAVAITSLANFLIADRWVFKASMTTAAAALLTLGAADADAATLRGDTVAAWNRHVAAVESRLDAVWNETFTAEPEGRSIAVPGGVIHEWRGSVRLRGLTVDQLVRALQVPGLPPPSEDVLEARVLGRESNGTLHVYLKLTRSAIVTVTYDTEHEVTFDRLGPGVAASRSVATRIEEIGGADHGFLWRLNSYWRYTQDGSDVRIELLSLSLSRAVPALARPIAGPLIERVGRESMRRTLDAMVRFGADLRLQAVRRQEPERRPLPN